MRIVDFFKSMHKKVHISHSPQPYFNMGVIMSPAKCFKLASYIKQSQYIFDARSVFNSTSAHTLALITKSLMDASGVVCR
jgi:hypothetical protein